MNYPKLFALFAAAVFLAGCSSAGLDQARSIRIRTGLTQQEAKAAILAATLPDKKPREWLPANDLSDRSLEAAYLRTHQKVPGAALWSVDEIREDSLILTYEHDKYLLRVQYDFGDRKVAPHIVASRNLNQTANRIHGNAVEWINELQGRIDDNMDHLLDAKKLAAEH
jgi:hypothetical protein